MPATSTEKERSKAESSGPEPSREAASSLQSFLGELLAEQQRLETPVIRAAAAYERTTGRPSSLGFQPFREAIPLTAPGPGEQYAFEVDLDACSGCKACVAGCHSLNGLDEHETWRDVGLVLGGGHRDSFQQTITSACHHCADPACANGCPVLAYEKDPITGIVRHLDDQCIGCSYCILKCPYDVPKYNDRLGIVRKCDLCHGRLAAGEAPACVQACPTHAIKITKVAISDAGPDLASAPSDVHAAARTQGPAPRDSAALTFLPVFPDPAYTRPTTRYISKRALPTDLRAADSTVLRVQPPHWPLVFLLTLMAMAVGCSMADKIVPTDTPALAVTGWLAGVIGLVFSILHLGQPTRAWRIFLGLRKSWLSREAVVFGLWLPLATAHTAVRLGWLPIASDTLRAAIAAAGAVAGTAGLFCSVMIYADTRREFWRFASAAPRFFGTAAVLGLASALALAPGSGVAAGLAMVMLAKLAFETRALRPLDADHDEDPAPPPAYQTARVLAGPLRRVWIFRILSALAVAGTSLVLTDPTYRSPAARWFVLAAAIAGELAERYLFFRAVVAPKMPGLPAFAPAKRRHA